MDRLLAGYQRFLSDVWPEERSRYEALAKSGQTPEVMIISCCDSRVDPQTIFGASPGELFVVRNVAGLVPPYAPDARYHGTSAALEFGVRVLKVRRIVVLGHALCGGVRTIVEGAPEAAQEFVLPWMEIARPALPTARAHEEHESYLYRCETSVVRISMSNLMTFPWIGKAVTAGLLAVEGYRFDIRSGELVSVQAVT
ncbi:MAG: carbonic anhydrase [Hyphomicrobiales bacterium]